MGKKRLTTEILTEISNKVMTMLVSELGDDDQTVNPGELICVMGIMHRTLFANIERNAGIEKAREETAFLLKLVASTMENGAWDEEEQCIK